MLGVASGFLLLLFLVFGRYRSIKKQIRYLADQIEELLCENSEKMLDLSLIDGDLERLAGLLNRYQEAQRQKVAAALRREDALRESVANISHDLRTPLTVLSGHLQLLEKSSLTEEQKRRLAVLRRRADRMEGLVEEFYELSVLEEKQEAVHKEWMNLSNLFMDLLAENGLLFKNRDLRPEVRMPECSVFIFSDCRILERIFQNLLTNAARYSAGTVRISLYLRGEDAVVFSVENPVDDSFRLHPQQMFERFYTGDPVRKDQGTGLGLAVARILTERLGGKISADIQSGRFTVFVELKKEGK